TITPISQSIMSPITQPVCKCKAKMRPVAGRGAGVVFIEVVERAGERSTRGLPVPAPNWSVKVSSFSESVWALTVQSGLGQTGPNNVEAAGTQSNPNIANNHTRCRVEAAARRQQKHITPARISR